MVRESDNDQGITIDYVLDRFRNNKHMRQSLAQDITGLASDMHPIYLLTLIKTAWPDWDEIKKSNIAKTIAGPMYYDSFLEIMEKDAEDETKSA